MEEVHALSAGLKALTTAFTAGALSVCRESCGGHGYAAVNRLGALRSDHDIFQTFEGDNTVLLQQVGWGPGAGYLVGGEGGEGPWIGLAGRSRRVVGQAPVVVVVEGGEGRVDGRC